MSTQGVNRKNYEACEVCEPQYHACAINTAGQLLVTTIPARVFTKMIGQERERQEDDHRDLAEDPAKNGCVCGECGHEQPTMDRCARCRSFRVVLIDVVRCEFGDDWRAACFPSTRQGEFVSEEPPMLRVVMKDGRTFEGRLFDRSYDRYKREGWFDLAVNHAEHPEIPEVFPFDKCTSVVDVGAPDVNLLLAWTEDKP